MNPTLSILYIHYWNLLINKRASKKSAQNPVDSDATSKGNPCQVSILYVIWCYFLWLFSPLKSIHLKSVSMQNKANNFSCLSQNLKRRMFNLIIYIYIYSIFILLYSMKKKPLTRINLIFSIQMKIIFTLNNSH